MYYVVIAIVKLDCLLELAIVRGFRCLFMGSQLTAPRVIMATSIKVKKNPGCDKKKQSQSASIGFRKGETVEVLRQKVKCWGIGLDAGE